MESKQSAIRSIEESMGRAVHLPHQAVAIGVELAKLMSHVELPDPEVQELVESFIGRLTTWGFEDLLEQQAEYAIRIADSDSYLEYEEMHKLFSLCDDICSMECIGLPFGRVLRDRYEDAVRRRFRQEPKKARMVAEDRVKESSRNKWWFKESLALGNS